MKNIFRSGISLQRYITLCLSVSVLTACGDGTVSSSVDNEQPATYTYSELVNLTSYDVGLYRFGSDGSAKLVRNIDHTGAVDAMFFGEINGITFFSTSTDTNGRELWRTDGTSDGTYMVQDVNPGTANGIFYGAEGIVFNNALYFGGLSQAYPGTALWTLVNESTGPEFVTNTRSSTSSNADPSDFLVYDGRLIFNALEDNGTGGTNHKVFVGTGTAGNDTLIDSTVSSNDGFSTDQALIFKGDLYFQGSAGLYADGGKGDVLYKSDGTQAGTEVLADINETIYLNSDARTGHLVSVGNYFVFPANDAADDDSNTTYDNSEIWVSDGTTAGTQVIKNLHPGTTHISSLVSTGTTAYFVAVAEGSSTFEIWRTQGTAATTEMIDGFEGETYLYSYGDQVIAVTSKAVGGYVVYQLNDATNDFAPLHTFSSPVDYAFALGDRIFVLIDNMGWKEVWSYNKGDSDFTKVTIGGDYNVGVNAH